jgi:hypothetical protein
MDWFYLYFLGFLIVIAAVGLGLNLIGVPPRWILVVGLFLLGIAVMSAVRHRGGGSGDA